jgi:hypothetical protein
MSCLVCGSDHQSEFNAETNVHLSGLANINNPGVLLFSKLLVCWDCGCSSFSTPAAELLRLAVGGAEDTVSMNSSLRSL